MNPDVKPFSRRGAAARAWRLALIVPVAACLLSGGALGAETVPLTAPIALQNNLPDEEMRVKFTIHGLGNLISDNRTVDSRAFRSVTPENGERAYTVTAIIEDQWASKIGVFSNEVRARSGDLVTASGDPDHPGEYLLGVRERRSHTVNTPYRGPKTILFAHGMKFWDDDGTKDWDYFSAIAERRGWTVYRTRVPGNGSIQQRAERLAAYINTLKGSDGGELPDNSLKAVGHSAGGLDLRYIVTHANRPPFRSAARKISKIYTIATPHKGIIVNPGGTPILDDLLYSRRAVFNDRHPYSEFGVPTESGEIRRLPLLAFSFMESDSDHTDGEVYEISQIWDGAPSHGPLRGRHSGSGPRAELRQEEVLDMILSDRID